MVYHLLLNDKLLVEKKGQIRLWLNQRCDVVPVVVNIKGLAHDGMSFWSPILYVANRDKIHTELIRPKGKVRSTNEKSISTSGLTDPLMDYLIVVNY